MIKKIKLTLSIITFSLLLVLKQTIGKVHMNYCHARLIKFTKKCTHQTLKLKERKQYSILCCEN